MAQRSRFVGFMVIVTCLCGAAQATAQTLLDSSNSARLQPDATGNFLQTTISDFKHLPSKNTLGWLTVGAIAASLSATVDQDVTSDFGGQARLQPVFHSGAKIGDARFQMAAAAVTFTAGHLSGNRKVAVVGGDLLRAQILAIGMTSATKVVARRTRPDGTSLSFPSGHTATAFATATVLQRDLGWKVGIPAYAAAAYVGASRIEDRKHFLSDVAFGAALGIVAGHTVTIGGGEARFAVAPTATTGGAGVNFTWVGKK